MYGSSFEADDVQILKPKAIQKKSVAELPKLDVKKTDSQLKDNELEIGLPTRQALDDVTNAGKQKQCYLGIRSFFTETVAYMNLGIHYLKLLHVFT